MAKTYLDIVKYMVEARFSINGTVVKPDIIGAVFGQTEGLLGDELDLRELQKNGKIGRIEIDIVQQGNRCSGKLFLPASLDRIETCILAAAIESVDRVGPYEAVFQVEKVEDIRTEKRRKILDRAKDLVKKLMTTGVPDSRELAELVQSEVRSSEISTYGPENIPAGPDIDSSNEVIIVEGRADVLNLLRYGITNTIAVGGATNNIPKTIIKLCGEKDTTIFVDGDRGGDMIIRSLLSVAEVDYVTKAPEGKEVEELTRKEVIKSLRTKMPADQYMGINKIQGVARHSADGGKHNADPGRQQSKPQPNDRPQQQDRQQFREHRQQVQPQPRLGDDDEDAMPVRIKDLRSDEPEAPDDSIPKIGYEGKERPQSSRAVENDLQQIEGPQPPSHGPSKPAQQKQQAKPALESWVLTQLDNSLNELSDTLRSRLVAADGSMIKEVPIRELIATIQDTDDIYGIVLDGIITQRLVELALQKNVHAIYGIRANPMSRKHPELILYTKEQGKLE